jgi:hypothetical protein
MTTDNDQTLLKYSLSLLLPLPFLHTKHHLVGPRELTADFSSTQIRVERNFERDQRDGTNNIYVERQEGNTSMMLLFDFCKRNGRLIWKHIKLL